MRKFLANREAEDGISTEEGAEGKARTDTVDISAPTAPVFNLQVVAYSSVGWFLVSKAPGLARRHISELSPIIFLRYYSPSRSGGCMTEQDLQVYLENFY